MSQKSKTFTVRVSQDVLAEWKAGVSGNFNAWVVSSLEEAFALGEAERRERSLDLSRRAVDKREREAELAKAFPQRVVSPSAGKRSFRPDPK